MLNSKIDRRISLVISCFMLALFAASAEAQQSFVYVSAENGSDTNACTQAAPCREVSRAMEVVGVYGTVLIVSNGEYDGFTITKSVNVIAPPGITAKIYYLSISSEQANSRIILRNLTFDEAGASLTDPLIVVSPIESLLVDDCKFLNGGEVRIHESGHYSFRNSTFNGIRDNLVVFANAGIAAVTIDGCHFDYGTTGVHVRYNAFVSISNSVATHNNTGFRVSDPSGRLYVENCVVTHNNFSGIRVSAGSVRVSHSTISDNGTYGIQNTGGIVRSFVNNRIYNNPSGNISGTVNPISYQ